ncbi:MAG: TetR/AcrR family transcriptional regulator [Desulfuromonadaceae bacterium]|nr:TetR/AcrR family transcriptional regulator [Desulfuromonadaceae bacterium]
MERVPRYLPAEARRAAIVDAVIGLASEQNPCSITTAAIAERMNLTQGALFRHFPDKAAIWGAVMGWVAEQLLTKVRQAIQNAPSTLAALESVFITHIKFIADHPGVPRMLSSELQRAEDTAAKLKVRALLDKYGRMLKELMKAGTEQGELAPELDIPSAVTAFIGIIQWLAVQSLLIQKAEWLCEEAPTVFANYRRGIEAAAMELPETIVASQLRDKECDCESYSKTQAGQFQRELNKMSKLSLHILLIMPDKDARKFLKGHLPSEGTPIAMLNRLLSGGDASLQTRFDLILGITQMTALDFHMLTVLSRLVAGTTSITVFPASMRSIDWCDLVLDCSAELRFFIDTISYLNIAENS